MGGVVSGMHGYDVTSVSARAALASDAPIPPEVTRLSHIAPWVVALLELPVASR